MARPSMVGSREHRTQYRRDYIRFLEIGDWNAIHIRRFLQVTLAQIEEDMCGIAAILLANANGAAAFELYDALLMLQHRGQGT